MISNLETGSHELVVVNVQLLGSLTMHEAVRWYRGPNILQIVKFTSQNPGPDIASYRWLLPSQLPAWLDTGKVWAPKNLFASGSYFCRWIIRHFM